MYIVTIKIIIYFVTSWVRLSLKKWYSSFSLDANVRRNTRVLDSGREPFLVLVIISTRYYKTIFFFFNFRAYEMSQESQSPLGQWNNKYSSVLATLGCTLGAFNISRFAILTVQFGG